jgi:hypothetical protein
MGEEGAQVRAGGGGVSGGSGTSKVIKRLENRGGGDRLKRGTSTEGKWQRRTNRKVIETRLPD